MEEFQKFLQIVSDNDPKRRKVIPDLTLSNGPGLPMHGWPSLPFPRLSGASLTQPCHMTGHYDCVEHCFQTPQTAPVQVCVHIMISDSEQFRLRRDGDGGSDGVAEYLNTVVLRVMP